MIPMAAKYNFISACEKIGIATLLQIAPMRIVYYLGTTVITLSSIGEEQVEVSVFDEDLTSLQRTLDSDLTKQAFLDQIIDLRAEMTARKKASNEYLAKSQGFISDVKAETPVKREASYDS